MGGSEETVGAACAGRLGGSTVVATVAEAISGATAELDSGFSSGNGGGKSAHTEALAGKGGGEGAAAGFALGKGGGVLLSDTITP